MTKRKRKNKDSSVQGSKTKKPKTTASKKKNTNVEKKKDAGGIVGGGEQFWSKSKKKRMRRLLAMQKRQPQQQQPKQQGEGKAGKETNEDLQKRGNKKDDGNDNPDKIKDGNGNDDNNSEEEEDQKLLQTLSFSSSLKKKSSSLQKSFMERLSGSRFRELNEELYTTHSSKAYQKFTSQPELFQQYHDGFKQQVLSWPTNPVNVMLRSIVSHQQKQQKNKKEKVKKMVVADFGCGEAKLASELLSIRRSSYENNETDEASSSTTTSSKKKRKKKRKKQQNDSNSYCPFEVHSFDLVSGGNPLITPCDMSNVPLQDNTVDVGVFCLALMGTNIDDFIREAHRVLKDDGLLKIAEVRSRFESSEPDDHTNTNTTRTKGNDGGGGLDEFLQVMKTLGFDRKTMNRSNKMFVMMDFIKNGSVPSKKARFTAKPCIYKRR